MEARGRAGGRHASQPAGQGAARCGQAPRYAAAGAAAALPGDGRSRGRGAVTRVLPQAGPLGLAVTSHPTRVTLPPAGSV